MICSHRLLKLKVSSSDKMETPTSSSSQRTNILVHHYLLTCSNKSSSLDHRQANTPIFSRGSSSNWPWLKLTNLIVESSIRLHPVPVSRTPTTWRASVAQSSTKHLNPAARWSETSFPPSIPSPKPAWRTWSTYSLNLSWRKAEIQRTTRF